MVYIIFLEGITNILSYRDIYCGDWKGNKFNGEGTFIYSTGERVK